MLIALEGMAGGNFSARYIIALLSGQYIMVRGLQNVENGLKDLHRLEAERDIVDGTGRSWYELWKAVFEGPYTASSLPARIACIEKNIATISASRRETLMKNGR